MKIGFLCFILLTVFLACQPEVVSKPNNTVPKATKPKPKKAKKKVYPVLDSFTNIQTIAPTIALDIRYASTDNFVKEQIYPCPACYLRPKVALALASANTQLRKKGYGIKVFDCYRPRPAQQRLWNKMPNANYVTPPSKGSMHNRGMAVDLTVYDVKTMKELYMGTSYDFFGAKAHTDCPSLSQKVIDHRKILTDAMTEAGFLGIRTEWWHFYFPGPLAPLSSTEWECQ